MHDPNILQYEGIVRQALAFSMPIPRILPITDIAGAGSFERAPWIGADPLAVARLTTVHGRYRFTAAAGLLPECPAPACPDRPGFLLSSSSRA